MKFLSKNEQDEILKRVTACQIICNNYVKDIEAVSKITENLADIAVTVGGCLGASKVMSTTNKYAE